MASPIFIIQAVIPDYRLGLFTSISNARKSEIICGLNYFSSVSSDYSIFDFPQVIQSNNIYLFNRKCLLQVWPNYVRTLFSRSIRVVELNPRCLTSWFSLLSSRFFKRGKTVVWGHLLNRAGEQKKFSARQFMLWLANGALFYTKSQMETFQQTAIGAHKVSGFAPNSVVFAHQVSHCSQAGHDFLYVGRLVAEKKPMILLDAFLLACEKGLEGSTLHFVGAGEEAARLQQRLQRSPFANRVTFHGHQSDIEFLKNLYEKAVCSVSPGYVGLSITQSLSFGRPMLISEHEPHAPEIEAFQQGENGSFFKTDDVNDLCHQLMMFYQQRDFWASKSEAMSNDVLANYTYEAMAAGFLSLIDKVQDHG